MGYFGKKKKSRRRGGISGILGPSTITSKQQQKNALFDTCLTLDQPLASRRLVINQRPNGDPRFKNGGPPINSLSLRVFPVQDRPEPKPLHFSTLGENFEKGFGKSAKKNRNAWAFSFSIQKDNTHHTKKIIHSFGIFENPQRWGLSSQ